MKPFSKILLSTLLLGVLVMIGGVIYLQSLKPQYSGNLVLEGLHKAVGVYFDPRAVPHISARNAKEAILEGAILGRKI